MSGRHGWLVALLAAVLLGAVACSSGAEADPGPGTAPALRYPIAPTAATSQLYVAPNGDDGAAGTQAAPLRSIARAAAMAKPGTNVVVAAGTYEESITTDVSGTAEARIAFTAASRGAVKIVGGGGADSTWHNTGDYVDIVGFDITGSTTDGLLSGGSYVRIASNSVHGFREGNCITVANEQYDLHDVDVIGNLAYGCGASQLDHGIYVTQPGGMVANNIAYGNAGYGIQCWHNCNNQSISNNLVFDNQAGGIVIGQGDSPNNGKVAADDFVVANNIAVQNGKEAIREGGRTGKNNRFLNNLVWQNERDRIDLQTGNEEGTIVADPEFVDFKPDGTGNYRLRTESPGVSAGVADGAPPTDIDGKPRPVDGGIDIGPYQD